MQSLFALGTTTTSAGATQQAQLLQRTDQSDSHSTRKQDDATQSIFANYVYGPMDMDDGNGKDSKKDAQGANAIGTAAQAGGTTNPLIAGSMGWVTTAQQS